MNYHPNRVGPFPVFDLDASTPFWAGTFEPSFTSHSSNVIAPAFDTDVVEELTAQAQWHRAANSSLTAGQAWSVAVSVNGEAKNNIANMFSFNISWCTSWENAEISAMAFVGRLTSGTISLDYTQTLNDCGTWWQLPARQSHAKLNTYTQVSGNYQGSILNRDTKADGYGSNPIVAGVCFYNRGAAAADAYLIDVSMNIQKYVSAIDGYDPLR